MPRRVEGGVGSDSCRAGVDGGLVDDDVGKGASAYGSGERYSIG